MAGAYPSMMGSRLRRIRRAHGTSLRTLAEQIGTSPAYLSQVESGRRALDRHSMIIALATALGSSPDMFTTLPVPAPGNGAVDSAIEAVRQALLAVGVHRPGGRPAALDALQARVAATVAAHRCGERPGETGAAIAALIRDLHSSLDAPGPGADAGSAGLRELVVRFHAHATQGWLRVVGAPVDLRLQVGTLTHRLAQDIGTAAAQVLSASSGLPAMISAGLLDLARQELDAIDVAPTTPESARLAGLLAVSAGLLAAVDSRPDDAAAGFDRAAQLAERADPGGCSGASAMGFGPATVALWRMYGLLDVGDHPQAVQVGAGLRPLDSLSRLGRADYWVTYARALARRPGRRAQAGHALRHAEQLCPLRLYRDPFARDLLTELLTRSPNGASDQDLRDLARRAGLVGA